MVKIGETVEETTRKKVFRIFALLKYCLKGDKVHKLPQNDKSNKIGTDNKQFNGKSYKTATLIYNETAAVTKQKALQMAKMTKR